MTFDELGLNEGILEAISYMGFNTATPIQEQVIPEILKKRDVIACAQTGTGKTAAFVLPTLQHLSDADDNVTKALIVVPTRELAIQIEQVLREGLKWKARSPKIEFLRVVPATKEAEHNPTKTNLWTRTCSG